LAAFFLSALRFERLLQKPDTLFGHIRPIIEQSVSRIVAGLIG